MTDCEERNHSGRWRRPDGDARAAFGPWIRRARWVSYVRSARLDVGRGSPRARGSSALVPVVVLFGLACGQPELEWQIEFEDQVLAARAVRVHTAILPGGCAALAEDALYESDVTRMRAARPVPDLAPGTWGFDAWATDAECTRFAHGCTELSLPADIDRVFTHLAAEPDAPRCPGSECREGLCAGELDAGAADAGARRDAGPELDAEPPRDGGPGDASGPDAGPLRPCGSYLFCDDFETGIDTRWIADVEPPGTLARRGGGASSTWSLEARAELGFERAMLRATVFGPAHATRYVRVRVLFPDGSSRGSYFVGFGNDDMTQWVALTYDSERGRVNGLGFDQQASVTDGPMPTGVWVCFELALGPRQLRVEREERVIFDRTLMDDVPAEFRTTFAVGVIEKPPGDDAKVVYVDDVIADDAPIGCAATVE